MSPTSETRSPFEVLADYEQRSLSHVAGMPEQIEAPGLWRGIGYRLGTRHLASGFNEVVEIITLPPLTPVPGGDHWLLGVANIRSTLLPVVDLKLFLEGERTVQHETTRALVVRQAGGNVAVLIDELYGQRNFTDENKTELVGIDEGRYGSFVKQAYRLGDTVWGVFSMTLLARTPEFRQAAAA
jgi:twitching motility protein PilI